MKTGPKPGFTAWAAAFLALAALAASGCSTVGSIGKSAEYMVQDLVGADSDLKRKIILAPFGNPWNLKGADVQKDIVDQIRANLDKGCGSAVLLRSPGVEQFTAQHQGSPTGLAQNLEVMEPARKAGAMALVTGALWDISSEKEKRGIYGFRKERDVLKVCVNVWVYDTLTGAKLLDQSIEQTLVLPPGSDPAGPCPPEILKQVADEASQAVCYALKDTAWKSFVTAAQDAGVTLSAGRDAGLAPGDKLVVYGPGTTVTGVDKEQFIIPGPRLGAVKVARLSQDTCEATVLEGKDFPQGSWAVIQ